MQSELGLYLIQTRGDLVSPEGASGLKFIQSGDGLLSACLHFIQIQVQAHIRVPGS